MDKHVVSLIGRQIVRFIMLIYVTLAACLSGLALTTDPDFCSSTICTMDLVPHCMTDGTIALGCSEWKHAICNQSKTEVEDWDPTKNCIPEGYCEQQMCTMDYIPHCMRNGAIVNGCSELKNAICIGNLVENTSWKASDRCFPYDFCEWKGCTKDLVPFCLTDGSIVNGCEGVKKAVCTEDKWVNVDWQGGECEETE